MVFVRVTQRAIRRVALGVFRHLHSLSLRFHLERQTGGMTRDIERGTRGISTLLSYLIFSIFPVILEFALVAAVLIAKFDWRFAAITFGAVAVYILFTVLITEWRMEIRRRANELDSRANTRAVDSLLNYETVKYFGNEEFEARRYDEQLGKYEDAATQQRGLARRAEHRPEPDHRPGGHCANAAGGRGRGGEELHARRPGAGERAPHPALHPAQFPRHGVPRDQAGDARHGPHVPAADGAPRGRGSSRRARAAGRARRRWSFPEFSSATKKRGRSCSTSASRSRRAIASRWWATPARASPRSRACSTASTTSPRERSRSTALT